MRLEGIIRHSLFSVWGVLAIYFPLHSGVRTLQYKGHTGSINWILSMGKGHKHEVKDSFVPRSDSALCSYFYYRLAQGIDFAGF